MLWLCSDHHHFYFLICVHTCVFCSRTFATFRAVLEFAACHGCIEFSAKRGTKLLQAKEKIVSSQARKEKKKKKKGHLFCATFQSKDEKWQVVQNAKICHFHSSNVISNVCQTSTLLLDPSFQDSWNYYWKELRSCAQLHATGVLTTCINDPHKSPSTYFPFC